MATFLEHYSERETIYSSLSGFQNNGKPETLTSKKKKKNPSDFTEFLYNQPLQKENYTIKFLKTNYNLDIYASENKLYKKRLQLSESRR